jgi:hypothetical protein
MGARMKNATFPDTDAAQGERLAGALFVLDGLLPAERTAVAAYVLDRTGAGFPELPAFGDIRETAELWADCASHIELEVYTVAGLRRLGKTPLGLGQRKRLLAALWETLDLDDRRAFLARVDLAGRFHGRAA